MKGIFPLMPFVLKQNYELDLEGLKSNIEGYEKAGFDGFVAFGCMGEFYAPSYDEWTKVVDTAVGAVDKLACVFGTTFHNTDECIKRTKYAENAGADGVMIGAPYLIPVTFEVALDHFRRVNDSVDEIQIMTYNNPSSFRFNMTSEFWDKLMELDRIKAVKESNGDVVHRTRVVSHISDRINVFPGGENWLLGDSLLGSKGIVSVVGPGASEATRVFYDACMRRDLDKAIPFHVKFTELYREMTSQNEVGWFKACAELGGFKAGPPRPPYVPLDPRIRRDLGVGLQELGTMVKS
ncbi:MAG TPA: dihydrodipicolinate synthase family protein [Candidatus Bathyarchaeia archaeon]|nr:dihydrodipicolinate synthase family protein [Candidatus Bathyarchaeia archaeon]